MSSDFGTVMKALRQVAGLSLGDLAKRIPWSRAAIGHAETGARRPSHQLAEALDHVLSGDGLLVALAAAERAQGRNVEAMNRRALLAGGALALVMGVEEPSGRTGKSDVDRLLRRTAKLRRLDDSVGGGETFVLYVKEMEGTQDILGRTSYTQATRRSLHAVLAEQAQLAGWAAFDAGWHKRSAQLYELSRVAAHEAEDDALTANAFALQNYQHAFIGQPDVDVARASCAAITERVPPQVRALIHDRAAFAFAAHGLESDTELALDCMAEALAAGQHEQTPDWARWVDATELDIMTGRCWAALRRPLRAVVPLVQALADFPDECARDKALYLLALSEAYAVGGELQLAAETIARASALTVGVASKRPRMRLRYTLATVAEFDPRDTIRLGPSQSRA